MRGRVLITSVMALVLAIGEITSKAEELPFYIGTYTGGTSQGIYLSSLNTDSGAMATPKLVAKLENPSFLALHPSLPILYAVSEVRSGGKRSASQVSAYQINADRTLKEMGGMPSGGNGPCYVSVDHKGRYVFVANYGSGSIASIKLNADGSLGTTVSQIQHEGSSINPQRQKGPHAHCIMADPSNRYVCAVDLGIDQVVVYRLDEETGELTPTGKPYQATPGNGPRHLAFHPGGERAFVIHELASKISSLAWNDESGEFSDAATLTTLPPSFQDKNTTAEVLVHPNGKFVYGSNRGHDSIVCFKFDSESGDLTWVQHVPTQGKTPRNFRLTPSGNYLLAENQATNSIYSFGVDTKTGKLSSTGQKIELGSPCCIKFLTK